MDESAPITWLIQQIDAIVTSGASSAASALATTITPLVSVLFGIYILLVCVQYLRGAETEPVLDFGMRIAGFAVVIGIGLNASNYTSIVIPVVTGLGSDIASAVSGGSATAGTLDQLALHYLNILDTGYTSANAHPFPFNTGPLLIYFMKALCILVGLIPFLVAATLCLIVANVGSVMVAMVGPIFFACLIFPATRQYFSAWVNAVVSYALIPIFVAAIATISIGLSKTMFADAGGTLSDVSFKTVFLASMGNLTLLFLLRQVSSLASSLSAGGINAAMPGGIGALAGGIRSGIAGSVKDLRGMRRAAGGVWRGAGAVVRFARNPSAAIRRAISSGGGSVRKAG